MVYQLKLNKTLPQKKNTLEEKFGTPVRWWEVSTEGDCEGKSSKHLGIHYGHIAEIAFSLGNQGGYQLYFEPREMDSTHGSPEYNHPNRQAVCKEIHISIGNETWLKGREGVLEVWLDCPEVKVKPSNYHGAVELVLL